MQRDQSRVHINFYNENNHAPDITGCGMSEDNDHVEINEDTPEGGKVCTIVCSDQDANDAGVVTLLQLGSSPDSPLLVDKINSTHWDIFLTRTVNHKLDSQFTLTFLCFDNGDPKKTTRKDPLTFWVTDVNNHEPVFAEELYEVTLSEGVEVGSNVVTVLAYDSDSEQENARVIYRIEDSAFSHWFSVEDETGST